MAKPKGGLGRGLGALIPPKIAPDPGTDEAKDVEHSAAVEVPVDAITENPHQPRQYFSPSDLRDLMDSIKEHGIMVPLVVTESGKGTYELIAGERRLRSARELGMKTVPVMVRDATEQQKLELALIENIQRQQLNAAEEARAYKSLMDLFNLSQDAIAKRVGKSRSQIANTIRLLDLGEEMLSALEMNKITRSQARTLLSEKDLVKREDMFQKMLTGDMTIREAEARVKSRKKGKKKASKDPNIAALENELRSALGTKVKISMKGAAGKVTVHVYSKEELKEIIEKLTK